MESVLEIPLSIIDEDPNQPRVTFNQESLRELAETIRERGVKTPVSVRVHPYIAGRYMINHGARRFRASLLAGKETIPACIDNEYTEEDQLIENLHRDNLTPQEIAEFIGKLLAKGAKRIEIARRIGKSSAYITQHLSLLDLPEPIAQAFESGRCNDVTVIHELVNALKRYPQHTAAWIEDTTQDITRTSIKMLREFLASPEANMNAEGQPVEVKVKPKQERADRLKTALKNPVLMVEVDGRQGVFLLKRIPSETGKGWVLFEGGEKAEVPFEEMHIKALVEG